MFDKFFEVGKNAIFWLSSHPNRLRLKGVRVEIIAAVTTRNPELSILLGQSPYGRSWAIPQEGVNLKETFKKALWRCLEVECGLKLPDNPKSLARKFYVRSTRYIGTLDLPKERHGERLVADNATGTPLESIELKSKGYWMASIIVKCKKAIVPVHDGTELIDLKWVTLEEARNLIQQTNRPEKAALLSKCLDLCAQDLQGRNS